MSIDLNRMPKLGFGLMRLPEQDGKIDLEEVCRMVDAYLAAGLIVNDNSLFTKRTSTKKQASCSAERMS